MKTNSALLMLGDISRELLQKALVAKGEAKRTGSDFERGRHFAFYETISLLTQQIEAFGIDAEEVGLGGIDPERDLLGG